MELLRYVFAYELAQSFLPLIVVAVVRKRGGHVLALDFKWWASAWLAAWVLMSLTLAGMHIVFFIFAKAAPGDLFVFLVPFAVGYTVVQAVLDRGCRYRL